MDLYKTQEWRVVSSSHSNYLLKYYDKINFFYTSALSISSVCVTIVYYGTLYKNYFYTVRSGWFVLPRGAAWNMGV